MRAKDASSVINLQRRSDLSDGDRYLSRQERESRSYAQRWRPEGGLTIAGMSRSEARRVFSVSQDERRQNLGALRSQDHIAGNPRQGWAVEDPFVDDWHKQLPADLNTMEGRLKAKLAERKFKTKVAVAHLMIPDGADWKTEQTMAEKIYDDIDKGTLKPESVLKGRKVEDIIRQIKEKRETQPAEATAGHLAEQERQEVAAPVQGHDAKKLQEEEAKAKKKERNARKRKSQKAKKKASKLATVDEDAPERQSSLQRSGSRDSSAHSGDDAMSFGTSVWGEHEEHEGSHAH